MAKLKAAVCSRALARVNAGSCDSPKTFLELSKLHKNKNVLLRKRKQTQDNVDRSENGLSKLYKVCCVPQQRRAPAQAQADTGQSVVVFIDTL